VPSLFRRGRALAGLVFLSVFLVRTASLASLASTSLSSWHLWTETDEHAFVEWSARLARGNWADVPAYRAYFNWQREYGPPEEWENWYQKNAYYAGPLYPYGLAVLRLTFGSPFLPARLLQLLLACIASSTLALAVKRISEDFLREGRGEGKPEEGYEAFGSDRRIALWCAILAGVLYGTYGPLVFHDFFLYRDGPVAHLSTLLLALPLIARRDDEEKRETPLEGGGGRTISQGVWFVLFLGLLGGFAMLLKQTVAPLALASLWAFSFSSLSSPSASSPSKQSPGGAKRRSLFLMGIGLLGLALPLSVLAIRNVSAGVPPLTFDTRQAIGLAWGNASGADATTNPPPGMEEILDEAKGSTTKTARLVLESYRGAPSGLPKLFLRKFATFSNAFEVPDNANFYFFRDRIGILRMLPVFPCLLGVGIVGLCAALTRGVLRREEGFLAGAAILTPLAACLLVQTTSRYRAAVAGPLALGTGLFFLLTFEEIRRRRTRRAFTLVGGAAALSLVPLLPSVIPAGHHRFADTMVYATLLEGEGNRAEAAREIQRYLEEGADDGQRNAGIVSLRHWYETGDRSGTLVAPEGIAPPDRRVKKKG
jgi:hypothetical protein